jgi:REP element-mobilizing transposase RayT
MKEPALFLADPDRRVVVDTIRKHCAVRGWPLHAVNARTNHVHVVVSAVGHQPETVRDQFKAWCTRRLKEARAARTRFWTEGGSCRWINQEADLEAAVLYVLEAQDRKGAENE